VTDYSDKDHKEDMKVLHSMGYAQELSRSMSKFSNFAISFSIICILSGGINSFAQAISSVGGAGAGIGWIVGCLLSGMFALSMAQVASAFPTAGGLYHWASILGNRFWGWLTAWLNLLGLITVLGAINIGTAYFFQGAFGSLFGTTGADGAITPFPSSDWEIVGFVAVITIIQAIFNHIGIKATTFLTDVSGYIIFATTAVLVVACLAYAPAIDISRLWTFTNYSGDAGGGVFPQSDNVGYLFLLCLLLPVYTITGYDASAHTSEETKNAAISVPKGIVSAVLWSSLIGWIMICAVTLAIPDMDAAAAQGWGMFFGTINAIMPAWLAKLLFLGIFIAQLLCGLATVTSASRMLFAFSRDGGMPVGSKALASVNPRFRTPVTAIWTATVLCILYVVLALLLKVPVVDDTGAPVLGEDGAQVTSSIYVIVVNSTLVFLFLSFTIPLIAAMLSYGTAKWPNPGPWAMSKGLYKLVTLLSVIGMAVILFIAVAPPNERVLYVVVGFLVLAMILWVAVENRRFEGPPTGEKIASRQTAIKAAEAAVGEKA
jgi:amino acid transporter